MHPWLLIEVNDFHERSTVGSVVETLGDRFLMNIDSQ